MKTLDKFLNDQGVIAALAIDQRGSLKRMLGEDSTREQFSMFKSIISEVLTEHATAILLDPEFGMQASEKRAENAGLLLSYEQTGYDKSSPGRLPRLLSDWSVKELKEAGAEAIKLLVYYDVDEDNQINDFKKKFIDRVGYECLNENIPFFLEIVTYDVNIEDSRSREYAAVKPHKVIEAMREFSKTKYNVDVLKVEVPVNMNFVEGYNDEPILTKEEAEHYFNKQSNVTNLPFIFLSAGVSTELFIETLEFAHNAGSEFNGILCGRAIWKESADIFIKEQRNEIDKGSSKYWMQTKGTENIKNIMNIVNNTAKSLK